MMDALDRAPRWFIMILLAVAFGLCWILSAWVVKNAFADLGTIKAVAYQAKNKSDENEIEISQINQIVTEIKTAQETFRREYRDDQKDLDKKLNELLRRP